MVSSTANSLMIAMISSCRGDNGRELISSTIARGGALSAAYRCGRHHWRTSLFDGEPPNSHADDLVL